MTDMTVGVWQAMDLSEFDVNRTYSRLHQAPVLRDDAVAIMRAVEKHSLD